MLPKDSPSPDVLARVLDKARSAAIAYYRLTGRPLGITGEIGECEAARLLGLTLAPPRAPGYDAIDGTGRRYQIKTRCLPVGGKTSSQRLSSIQLIHGWDAALLVTLDADFRPLGVWEAERDAVVAALACPGSRARNERRSLSVSHFKRIGHQRWPLP